MKAVFQRESSPGTGPGILVLHGGSGITEHERQRAQRLAELGYVAYVPALFDEPFRSREHGIEVISGLVADPARLRARVGRELDWLAAQPTVDPDRTAAIGFCFGGLAALELARSGARVRCVVSFHGGLHTQAPAAPHAVHGSVLVCTGAADPFVPPEHRAAFEAEMTQAQASWQLHVYGGAPHGFTESGILPRPGVPHHAAADRASWRAMRALFDEVGLTPHG